MEIHTMTMYLTMIAVAIASLLATPSAFADDAVGSTTVLKWSGGKQAVFLLAFDDGCPTHRTKVIPELIKRNIPATFYVISGNDGLFGKQNWQQFTTNPIIVLGNHTFMHKDVPSVEHFEDELAKANAAINAKCPNLPVERLISFGKSGGVKWSISDEQINGILPKYNLVRRPNFFSYPWNVKNADDMHKLIDKTIASGKMGHLDFHGIDGDWLSTPWDFFTDLLDTLEANRDKLWLADHVSYHKYMTEQKTATVKQLPGGNDRRIELELTCEADAKLYDMPLTLSTAVPAGWKQCHVTQGNRKATVTVIDGRVMYDALPGGGTITVSRAN